MLPDDFPHQLQSLLLMRQVVAHQFAQRMDAIRQRLRIMLHRQDSNPVRDGSPLVGRRGSRE